MFLSRYLKGVTIFQWNSRAVYETGIFALENRLDVGVERTSPRIGGSEKNNNNKRTKKQNSKTPYQKAERQN